MVAGDHPDTDLGHLGSSCYGRPIARQLIVISRRCLQLDNDLGMAENDLLETDLGIGHLSVSHDIDHPEPSLSEEIDTYLQRWYNGDKAKAVNLGLDLQGGMHLVLRVDSDAAVTNEVVRMKENLRRRFVDSRVIVGTMTAEDIVMLKRQATPYPLSGRVTLVVRAERLRSGIRGDLERTYNAVIVIEFDGTRTPMVTVNGQWRYHWDLDAGVVSRM